MKKILILVPISFLSVLFNLAVSPSITKIFHIKIDLTIIMLIFFNMYLKYDLAMPLNIIAGITKDALSLSFFGIYTTIFTFMGMLMNLSVRRFVKENCWTNIFITLLMTFLILSLVETAGCILDNQINFYKVLPWQSILQTSAINSVISPVCFRVLSRLTK